MPKIDLKATFDLLLVQCRATTVWNEPSERELACMFEGFKGCFKSNPDLGLRKNPLPWQGFVLNNGTIDEKMLLQCMQSTFCRLFRYHLGDQGNYLGTIINAHQNLGICFEGFGLNPCEVPKDSWKLAWDSEEYKALQPAKDANRAAQSKFADNVDTICQVFVLIGRKGQTSSVPGDQWRKALGYA